MTPPLIRANGKMFTRASVAIRMNGAIRVTDVESIEWSDEVPAELISSGADRGAPLGISLGDYRCSASISIFADAASNFEDNALNSLVSSPVSGEQNLTSQTFQLTLVMREEKRLRVIHLANCLIVGRPSRMVGNDGTALVKKYQIQPLFIVENDKALVTNGVSLSISQDFDTESTQLNYVYVAGVSSPGRARISNLKIPYHWDIKEGYGRDTAFMTFRGRGLAKFTLTITMWQPEQFREWPKFAKLLEPPTNKANPFVVKMKHPALSLADVAAVTLLEQVVPERQPNGQWVASFECTEWRESLKVIVKPRGAIPDVAPGPLVTPVSDSDKALVQMKKDVATAALAPGGSP